MKTFNKLFVGLILAFTAMATLSVHSQAVTYYGPPKECKTIAYTLAITSVTQFTVLQATNTAGEPGVIYSAYLSTGVAGDYFVLMDTTTAAGTVPLATNAAATNQVGPRMFFGSTAAGTSIVFDPPILFYTGLMGALSSANDQATVCFDTGRGLHGN